jgi:hypothetical protein
MTLGRCSLYIELCPPMFGYSSKHMESLWCLLHCRLMSMLRFMSLINFCGFIQGNFYPNQVILSTVCLLNFMSQPSRESNQVQIQNRRSSLPDHRDPLVFSRWLVEDLRIVSFTLPLYSYLSFEDLEVVARAMKSSSPAAGITSFLKMHIVLVYLRLILRCRSNVYFSWLHFIYLYDMDLQCTLLEAMISSS